MPKIKVLNSDDLRRLLDKLNSKDSKFYTILKLAEKGIDIPEEEITSTISFFEKSGKYFEVGRMYEVLAIRFLTLSHNHSYTDYTMKMTTIRRFHGHVPEILSSSKNFDYNQTRSSYNRRMYQKAYENFEKAMFSYERACRLKEAERIAKRAELTDKVEFYRGLRKLLK